MNTAYARYPQPRITGFSLLEVLISLVILSVGLLGIAGLMTGTLKSNDSAYMRTQATSLAYNILDRMRANSPATIAWKYQFTMPAAAATGANPTSCDTGACTSDQLAAYDLDQWEYELAHSLPQGRGSVTMAQTSSGYGVTVKVLWNDSRANQALGGAPAAVTFSLAVNAILQ